MGLGWGDTWLLLPLITACLALPPPPRFLLLVAIASLECAVIVCAIDCESWHNQCTGSAVLSSVDLLQVVRASFPACTLLLGSKTVIFWPILYSSCLVKVATMHWQCGDNLIISRSVAGGEPGQLSCLHCKCTLLLGGKNLIFRPILYSYYLAKVATMHWQCSDNLNSSRSHVGCDQEGALWSIFSRVRTFLPVAANCTTASKHLCVCSTRV